MIESEDTPRDYLEPLWDSGGKVHEWKNYISEEIKGLWLTISPELRAAIARQAYIIAGEEEWD